MQAKPTPPPKRRRRLPLKALGLLVLVLAYGLLALTRPTPNLTADHATGSLQITTQPSNLPWPAYGQAAMGLVGSGVVATHGTQKPAATASIAKVLTALTVLQKYPLSAGQAGPTITLDATDVNYYNDYVAGDGSVVAVQNGERITERQLLEAMLLPSGNNAADSLARWAYGSLPAYANAANAYAAQLGLTSTHAGSDASGYAADSTSTASDLVRLGIAAMQNPALAAIVGERSATIPVAGTITNRNTLLGSNQVVGIKTGNNDQDAGAFLGAATTTVNGVSTTVVTAIMGAPSLNGALSSSASLLTAASNDFASTNLVTAGEVLGTYQQPWGGSVQAVAAKDLTITTLQGNIAKASFTLRPISLGAKAGQVIGTLSAPKSTFSPAQSVPISLEQAPSSPSFGWRLLHPF